MEAIIAIIIIVLIVTIRRINNKSENLSHQQSDNRKDTTINNETYTARITDATANTRQEQPLVAPQIKKKTGIRNEVATIEKLYDEQQAVYEYLLNTTSNVFITGKAGTGKSVLLQYYVAHTEKQVAVVAPTGVAALNVGGQTIHSFFGLPPLDAFETSDKSSIQSISDDKKDVLRHIEVLVIDEISMVRSDLLDIMDKKMRYARNNDEPFGGCQIIAFGDLFQIPPVIKKGPATNFIEKRYGTIFFYGADAVKQKPFTIIELNKIYRQDELKENRFIEILNRIRVGNCQESDIEYLNKNCVIEPQSEDYITMTFRKDTANLINENKLACIHEKLFTFDGTVTGDIKQVTMPTELHLKLKVGAQVMMIKNDRTDNTSNNKRQKARWVNGTIGTVSDLTETQIKVEIDGISHSIDKETWETYQYVYDLEANKLQKEVVGTFTQYPVKLAYALTVHKSQGQTFESAKLDLSGSAFVPGQLYVALSRCRSLEALYFSQPLEMKHIIVSQDVIAYLKSVKRYRYLDKD